jgi:gamma-glutamylcyclotransferase
MKPIRIAFNPDQSDVVSNGYYYFAYGTDLSLDPMSRNFSSAQYVGRATITNYRWIINDRGVANIFYAPGNWVEGHVYSLSPKDADTLTDAKRSRGFYPKSRISVKLWEAPDALYGRTPGDLKDDRANKLLSRADRRGENIREHPPRTDNDILVFASRSSREGWPNTTYAETINDGIRDARMLGMTDGYVERYLRQFVHKPGAKARIGGLIGWEDRFDQWRREHNAPPRHAPEQRLIPARKPANWRWWDQEDDWVREAALVERAPRARRPKAQVIIQQNPKQAQEIFVVVGKNKLKPRVKPDKQIIFGDWLKPKVRMVVDRRRRR